MGNRARRRWIVPRDRLFVLSIGGEEKSCDWDDTWGTQVAETPDKEAQGDTQPEPALLVASNRGPAIAVSLAALAVLGAATANSLPNLNYFFLANFDGFALPKFDRLALPNFDRFSWPNFNRFIPQFSRETVSVPIPDPAISATLATVKDIQFSQQQNAAVLVSLTQSSATQQADLKRISRQLFSLAAQAEALQNSVAPLTTSSIPHPNIRARVVRPARKTVATLPKPFGPVSVGGAPLSPAPAPGSGPG